MRCVPNATATTLQINSHGNLCVQVVLPTQRDAESYQVSLNSYPTLVTKDGHKFYVGAFRGTTAMADIGVEKFGQGDMYDNLRELYSLQACVQ